MVLNNLRRRYHNLDKTTSVVGRHKQLSLTRGGHYGNVHRVLLGVHDPPSFYFSHLDGHKTVSVSINVCVCI